MDLFDHAPELVERIFDWFVLSREFTRVMRLRLVSRQFKNCVDDAIYRLRLLSYPLRLGELLVHRYQDWAAYVYSYLAYQAWRERSTTSPVGRVYRAALALCEQDGDTGSEAVQACLKSLLHLATSRVANRDARLLLQKPTTKQGECSDGDLKADVYVAAVYLGRRAYVERLIGEGIQFGKVDWRGTFEVTSYVFGDAFRAATRQGDLGMIRLLLSCIAEYDAKGTVPFVQMRDILQDAGTYGHRAAFDFVLDRWPAGTVGHNLGALLRARGDTPWPENHERATAIIDSMDLGGYPCATVWLTRSAARGYVERVRHFLNKGAETNHAIVYQDTPLKSRRFRPLLGAIMNRHETMTRILLDAGADPNWYPPEDTALMAAARSGSIAIAKLLLDRGADVNVGCPPPVVVAVFKEHPDMFRLLRERGARLDTPETGGWAMALARLHGLDSMVDLLVGEGVGKDVILHRVGGQDECWWYKCMWPLGALKRYATYTGLNE